MTLLIVHSKTMQVVKYHVITAIGDTVDSITQISISNNFHNGISSGYINFLMPEVIFHVFGTILYLCFIFTKM